MELWLNVNISAHSIITSEYLKNNYNAVKSMIPSVTIYINKDNLGLQSVVFEHFLCK